MTRKEFKYRAEDINVKAVSKVDSEAKRGLLRFGVEAVSPQQSQRGMAEAASLARGRPATSTLTAVATGEGQARDEAGSRRGGLEPRFPFV